MIYLTSTSALSHIIPVPGDKKQKLQAYITLLNLTVSKCHQARFRERSHTHDKR